MNHRQKKFRFPALGIGINLYIFIYFYCHFINPFCLFVKMICAVYALA